MSGMWGDVAAFISGAYLVYMFCKIIWALDALQERVEALQKDVDKIVLDLIASKPYLGVRGRG